MLRFRSLAVLATVALVAPATRPGQAVETPDRAKLHKTIQGFWRTNAEKMAESAPGYKDGTPEQRNAILARMPDMVVEFTPTRMTRLPMNKAEKDEVEYTIVGAEGNALKLNGKRPGSGEDRGIVKVEVVDDNTLRIDGFVVLKRVKNRAGDPLK